MTNLHAGMILSPSWTALFTQEATAVWPEVVCQEILILFTPLVALQLDYLMSKWRIIFSRIWKGYPKIIWIQHTSKSLLDLHVSHACCCTTTYLHIYVNNMTPSTHTWHTNMYIQIPSLQPQTTPQILFLPRFDQCLVLGPLPALIHL